ncbi:MAG: helix-turn-helix transcriptional regulator [Rhodospirillaceae bacterium]|nr:helix-turn-helix transcriptional regulator [Rhodospirillaceae bacterium]
MYRKARLSNREKECLALLAQGLRRHQIAHVLAISVATVDLHFSNAKTKLHARTREQALVRAVVLGLVNTEGGCGSY